MPVTAQADMTCQTGFYVLRSRLNAYLYRYPEAIADMDAAVKLDPDNPALYVERGQRVILTYDWDRALADYNRALDLDSRYADAYYYRGILYASVPEGVDARRLALADFQRYLELAADGTHAADAARYAVELQAQLDALG
jgi:tetratricopeptide (TPR) repeat protein